MERNGFEDPFFMSRYRWVSYRVEYDAIKSWGPRESKRRLKTSSSPQKNSGSGSVILPSTGRKCHRTRKTAVTSIVIQWHPHSHLAIYNRSRVSTTKATFGPIFWLWLKVWAENPQGTFNLFIKVQEKVKLLKCVTKKIPRNCQPSNFSQPQGWRPPVQTSQQCNQRRRFINRHTSRSQDHLSLKNEE